MRTKIRRCRDCGRLLRLAVIPFRGPVYAHAPGAGKMCREAVSRRLARGEGVAAGHDALARAVLRPDIPTREQVQDDDDVARPWDDDGEVRGGADS